MTTTNPPVPAPFTNEDFAARMSRVVSSGCGEWPCRSHRYAWPGLGLAHRVPADGDH